MPRRILAIALTLVVAISLTACSGSSRKGFSTNQFKKFVQDSKKNGKMSYERKKKAYKGIFPKIKMD